LTGSPGMSRPAQDFGIDPATSNQILDTTRIFR
jgi:hypothetical protein